MKKLISLVLILTMVLGCCVFASATEAGDTLLIAPNPNAAADTTTETTEAPADAEAPATDDAAADTTADAEASEDTTDDITEDSTGEEEEKTTAGDVVRVVITVIQILAAIALVATVSFQSGKSSGLGATMSGTAETFMSKNKTASMEAKLVKATKILGVVFILLTLVLNILQAV